MAAKLRDVAALARVSPGTVSNVVHRPERVAADTAERVRAAIRELRYVPHEGARGLRSGVSTVLAHLSFEVDNPFGSAVAAGADVAAEERGYSLISASSRGDEARERDYLSFFERQRVAGILVSPLGDIEPELQRVRERGIAVVLLDWKGQRETGPSVAVDDDHGGRLAARHLVDGGYERLLFLGDDPHLMLIGRRIDGVAAVLAEAGGAPLEKISLRTRTIADGHAAVTAWLAGATPARRTGIVAVNDLVAVGALNALREAGVSVPGQVGVVGFDDLELLRGLVPLTSVHRPARELGARGVELLDRQVRGDSAPADVLLSPHLVVRGSSRA